ncbi:MAG: hypothetical protein HKN68_06740 [Saprospiraceae bacterium]|nr:hypothetical protein [Saprospiraceae bacterium]
MKLKYILITLTWCILLGCPSTDVIDQGKVIPSEFYARSAFDTAKTLILIPLELEGEVKNFLFDTGATVTTVQRDSIFGDIVEVRGASNRVVKNGSETLDSLKFGDVTFLGTFATNENMIELNDKIPNFGGVLGRTIINKANWLINYPEKSVEIATKDLSDDSFTDIFLDPSHSAPITTVVVDGESYESIIDLGSTSIFNVPDDTGLARLLLDNYVFEETERERYTVGGTQKITELIGVLPSIEIGELEFNDVMVNINQSSQIRVGMSMFTECVIYIDNDNHKYRIKKE